MNIFPAPLGLTDGSTRARRLNLALGINKSQINSKSTISEEKFLTTASRVREKLSRAGRFLLGINDANALDPVRNDLVFKLVGDLTDQKLLGEVFKAAGDHFRNDINAIWQRGNFFLLVNGALLAFYSSAGFNRNDFAPVSIVCFAGIAISYTWAKILDMSIRWINVWRVALVDTERAIVEYGPFARGENISGKGAHEIWRPEIFSKALARVFIMLWLGILLYSLSTIYFRSPDNSAPIVNSTSQQASSVELPAQNTQCQASPQKQASGP